MKNQETIAVVLAGITLAFAGLSSERAVGQDPARVSNSGGMQVVIPDDSFSVNGKRLKLPAPAQEVIKFLGKPTRETKSRNNTILTWDELGIHAYLKPTRETIIAVHFSLRKEAEAYSAKKVFAGKLTVSGAEVSQESTIEEINAKTKGKPFKRLEKYEAIMPNWWRAECPSGSLHVQTVKDSGEGIKYLSICAGE